MFRRAALHHVGPGAGRWFFFNFGIDAIWGAVDRFHFSRTTPRDVDSATPGRTSYYFHRGGRVARDMEYIGILK